MRVIFIVSGETMPEALLKVRNLKKYFTSERRWLLDLGQKKVVHAVDGVSFSVNRRETLSLVGETGCGKTTTGKMCLRFIEPTEGEIFFDGHDILSLDKKGMKKFRRDAQMIFQNPYAALNPRKSVEDILGLPLEVHGICSGEDKRERIFELLEKVGLSSEHIGRYSHEFSGGQRQRIVIARALALEPKFIVADEPVASLDLPIQAQILNLLQDLKEEQGLSYLLIAHNLSLVRFMSHSTLIMYLGKVVEFASTKELFNVPLHPYTKALMSSAPLLDITMGKMKKSNIKRIKLRGELPSPINPPSGC